MDAVWGFFRGDEVERHQQEGKPVEADSSAFGKRQGAKIWQRCATGLRYRLETLLPLIRDSQAINPIFPYGSVAVSAVWGIEGRTL
ncbi:hypothetical protein [Xanthomonas oryzae]|uniref:hypothetical protein n=1 Tax=Xanthomonas oryzae TaxID=347 RepID=UPI00059B395B|nr:hypothetical protein [Xanthomonas oryzae]AKN93992.1 hypothetical protein ACU13_14110 [Xanthomonas oryzae pv. oryzicola]AKN97670.1 hypothetical protein ACU10_13785 [Xanthomonas oryzae pv. oryzicola]AKO12941.1 hypothetical protein ACU14_14040 [Xanthomonas oryzae pv. oryzicola]AKO16679.1 hypothetical protein ACU12_14095 [Xanthomonas oryzae pv. oryzicola]AKO20450.1 hypothetical protein ACU11_14240 [Xanthomonas oryzae pv. oryzicola]